VLHTYINNLPSTERVILLIRHAERDPIDDMKDALQIRLTEKGHTDSENLGRSLAPLGPFSVYHSPVPRCMETAFMIIKGLSSESSLKGQLLELGGPYVKGDWMELVRRTRSEGPSNFIRQWFDTSQHNDIMVPLEEAALFSISFLKEQLNNNKTSVINVSHDWNLMILREYFFNLRHEDEGMPDFLDGIALFSKGEDLHLKYHDKIITL